MSIRNWVIYKIMDGLDWLENWLDKQDVKRYQKRKAKTQGWRERKEAFEQRMKATIPEQIESLYRLVLKVPVNAWTYHETVQRAEYKDPDPMRPDFIWLDESHIYYTGICIPHSPLTQEVYDAVRLEAENKLIAAKKRDQGTRLERFERRIDELHS